MAETRRESLWRHSGYMRYWSALSISGFGSEITMLALPLTAVTLLHAKPEQMGILTALGFLPYLIVGLPAGVWVDRLPRRNILVVSEFVRALALLTVPIAALASALYIEHLYLVTFLMGVFNVFTDVSEEAFLPALIGREQLVEGYSKLAGSTGIVEIAGPGAAGVLLNILSAPLVILIDVLTYLVSGVLLISIRVKEIITPDQPASFAQFRADLAEGVRYLFRHKLLRPMMFSAGTLQFFGGMFDALLILYLSEGLGMSPSAIGALYVAGSISGLIAASLAQRIVRGIGTGPLLILGGLLIEAGLLVTALASGSVWVTFVVMAGARFVQGLGNTWFNITYSSIIQTTTPDYLLGRVNASEMTIGVGALPIGALIGGVLGERLGLHPTLILAGAGSFLASLWMLLSPVRRLQEPIVTSHEG